MKVEEPHPHRGVVPPRPREDVCAGTEGNARLTGTTGAVLILLLAAEGATILRIRDLISVHIFLGMLLIPPVALKLATTGYRFVSYYAGVAAYRANGPPHALMRYLVAPVSWPRRSCCSGRASL